MQLILYHFEYCPYCVDVRHAINRLNVPNVETRDILENPTYKQELIALNGHRQVPCLLIDGKPMLESRDIIAFLERHYGP